MRFVQRLATLAIMWLLLTATSALAQERAEVSGGWRLLHINGSEGEDSINVPKGWYVDVAVHMNDTFSIVGDVGGNYKSIEETETFSGVSATARGDVSVHTFMGGVRIRASQNPRLVPFGQVLFGGANGKADLQVTTTVGGQTVTLIDESESSTDAALSVGGGVNVSAGSIGVRAQVDWLKIIEEDSGNAFRFAIGIVIPF
jgi:hypothetical protein